MQTCLLAIGSLLLAVELFCLQLCLGAILLTSGAFLLTAGAFRLRFEFFFTIPAVWLTVGICFSAPKQIVSKQAQL